MFLYFRQLLTQYVTDVTLLTLKLKNLAFLRNLTETQFISLCYWNNFYHYSFSSNVVFVELSIIFGSYCRLSVFFLSASLSVCSFVCLMVFFLIFQLLRSYEQFALFSPRHGHCFPKKRSLDNNKEIGSLKVFLLFYSFTYCEGYTQGEE